YVGEGPRLHNRIAGKYTIHDNYMQKGEPTPGQDESEQLIPTENIDPVINHDPIQLIEVDTDLIVSANVTDEDGDPLIVTLNYRFNQKDSYTKVEMELDSDNYRSEEHTSELQSRFDLVCRRLLVKKQLT